MQDGIFVENQISHPIGRSVFVFAGGTSKSRKDFEKSKELEEDERRARKLPDFLSRLHGFLDVFGIDPEDDEGDSPLFLIRRTAALRSLLWKEARSLFDEPEPGHFIPIRTPRGKLNIDPGVLRAFLWAKQYRHGVRSMEAIIADSDLVGKDQFDQSDLPSKSLLGQHIVDPDEFLKLVSRPEMVYQVVARLATSLNQRSD